MLLAITSSEWVCGLGSAGLGWGGVRRERWWTAETPSSVDVAVSAMTARQWSRHRVTRLSRQCRPPARRRRRRRCRRRLALTTRTWTTTTGRRQGGGGGPQWEWSYSATTRSERPLCFNSSWHPSTWPPTYRRTSVGTHDSKQPSKFDVDQLWRQLSMETFLS